MTAPGSVAASAYGLDRSTRAISPPVGTMTRSSSGMMAASALGRRSGRICVRMTMARSSAGAAASSRWSPASVTASVYSVPAASRPSAQVRRAHDANTTGQSERLRRSTTDHSPSEWRSAGLLLARRAVSGRDIVSNTDWRPHRTITRAAPKGSGGYTPAEYEDHPMTVAAVILAANPVSALADAAGTPAARRLADAAWAGGATPVVVCSFDPDGTVAASLANAEVTLADPVPPEGGPVGQIVNGIEAAIRLVTDTHAALVWPARLAWVDAETVTTLIAAHGEDRTTVVRPAYRGEPGFPVLLPVAHLDAFRGLAADRMPGDLFADLVGLGVPLRIVDTGDPGVILDVSVPRDNLPPFDGPPEPADTPEWGSAVADQPDDAPVAGPNRLEPAP